MNLQDRFDAKYTPEPNTGCWLWTASTDSRGYGKIYQDGRLRVATHVSLELNGTPIAPGMNALHRCDMPACVNPDHLFEGTQADNIKDMHTKNRGVYGTRNHRAKIDDETARLIRRLSHSGMSGRAIAAKVKVSVMTVSRVINGKLWVRA